MTSACRPGCEAPGSPTSQPDPMWHWSMCLVCGRTADFGDRVAQSRHVDLVVLVPRPSSLLSRTVSRGSALLTAPGLGGSEPDLMVFFTPAEAFSDVVAATSPRDAWAAAVVAAGTLLAAGAGQLRGQVVSRFDVLQVGGLHDGRLSVTFPRPVDRWLSGSTLR